jgi:hypothetical protein
MKPDLSRSSILAGLMIGSGVALTMMLDSTNLRSC